MYILKLYSSFREDDYEIQPLKDTDPFYFIKKYFHKPVLKNWVLEKTVEGLVKHYVSGDGSIVSEDDIISIEYDEEITTEFDGVEIILTGEIFVKGEMLDYNSPYRQKLIQEDLKNRNIKR